MSRGALAHKDDFLGVLVNGDDDHGPRVVDQVALEALAVRPLEGTYGDFKHVRFINLALTQLAGT